MIPGNTITPHPLVTDFAYLEGGWYSPLYQEVMGGIALNNPSQGRLVQPWSVVYAAGSIQVQPVSGSVVFTLPATDVQTISLAFDNNMAPVLAWKTSAGANLYYYDSTTLSYVTQFFSAVTSCKVCVDDPQDFYTSQSDVIFGYTLNNNLYWRQQRDRYSIERLVGATNQYLIRMGPSVGNRLQFECI